MGTIIFVEDGAIPFDAAGEQPTILDKNGCKPSLSHTCILNSTSSYIWILFQKHSNINNR